MPKAVFARSLGLALTLLVGACTTLKPVAESSSPSLIQSLYQQRLVRLQGVTAFEMSGRIALTGAALSGGLRWQQQGEDFELRIAGPFGAGALLLKGETGLVRIKNKDMDITTHDPASLLEERTGWPLPLEALRYWVLGVPAPGAVESLLLDDQGQVVSLQQSGWQLSFGDYNDQLPGTPGRLEAKRDARNATLLVQTMTLGAATP